MTAQFPEDSRQVARSQEEDGTWNFSQVDISEISFKGRFGALVGSFSSIVMGRGTHTFLLIEDPGTFRVGDDIQMTSLNDTRVFMWGEVIGSSINGEGGLELLVYADDISDVGEGETYAFWELQVVARPKPGIEKDLSTTSVDPTDGGPWTFTVTASKFFPVGGTLLLKPTADRTIALIGEVTAYSSTTLTVKLRATNATVSQAYTSWSIALLDSPAAQIPFLSIVGLNLDISNIGSDTSVTISPGSVLDSTGTVTLTLTSAMTKYMNSDWSVGDGNGGIIKVLATGTATSSGNVITGTGTLFTDEFTEQGADANLLNDYNASGGLTFSFFGSVLTGSNIYFEGPGHSDKIGGISSDTSASTNGVPVATNSVIYRNAYLDLVDNNYLDWYVVIFRKDSDGSIDVGFVTHTVSGEPDLPSGYSKYRVLGRIFANINSFEKIEHIYENNYPFAPKNAYFIVSSPAGDTRLEHEQILTTSTSNTIATVSNHIYVQRAALTGDVTASANSNATTIANDAVSNAKLNDMAAYTLKGRNEDSTGDPGDISIYALKARNRIVNPSMQISQENSNTAGTTSGYYPADQWSVIHSSDGAFSTQRVQSATPAGALDRLRVSCTTADATIGAAQYLMVTQRLEGSRMADFLFGTASAKAGIIRFGLKAPAGTYGVALKNAADNRAFVATVTVSVADTDEIHEVAFTGDTTGTWPTTNVHGWTLVFTLAAGSNYQGSTGWTATNDTTTSSQSNGMSVNTNVFEFFDVGLKMDVSATGDYGTYEVPDPTNTLKDCLRYYWKFTNLTLGFAYDATRPTSLAQFLVPMRIAPSTSGTMTYTVSAGSAGTVGLSGGGTVFNAKFYNSASNWTLNVDVVITGGLTARMQI